MKNLKEQAQELINCGNSREQAEGYGMMTVINKIEKLDVYEMWNVDLETTSMVIKAEELSRL